MHRVKCPVCGKMFDRDLKPYVKYGERRYAHAECCPNEQPICPTPPEPPKESIKDKEAEELKQLRDYIKYIYNDNVNWPLVGAQIKQYREQYNYKYSGIRAALVWFFEIQKNRRTGTNIGFVPLIYAKAKEYYDLLWQAQELNAGKDIKSYIPKVEHVTIQSPRAYVKPHRLFNMEDD